MSNLGSTYTVNAVGGKGFNKFFRNSIRFFTKDHDDEPCTHIMSGLGDLFGDGTEYVLSAENFIAILPLSRFQTDEYEIQEYKMREVPDEEVKSHMSYLSETYANKSYAFFQNLWFIYRWFMELFNKDVRKEGNWFPNSENCSEMGYYHLELMKRFNKRFRFHLEEWNPNCFSPADCANLLKKYPTLFQKV